MSSELAEAAKALLAICHDDGMGVFAEDSPCHLDELVAAIARVRTALSVEQPREVTGCSNCPFAAEADAGMYCTIAEHLDIAHEESWYQAKTDAPEGCPLRQGPLTVRLVVRP